MNSTDPALLVVERDGPRAWNPANAEAPDQRTGEKIPAVSSLAKRSLDVSFAAAAFIFLFPVLVIIGLIVRSTSAGPALFRQTRTGYKGQTFELLKFRTMFVNPSDSLQHATRADSRVTPIGSFLRATSLDELPQLINVLRGEMSLVGPRPHAVVHDKHYGQFIQQYANRFAVRPGLTGLAQVRGLRGEIHDISCMERRVQADCEYIERWTFLRDVHIIVLTVPRMFRDPNAY